MQTVFHLQKFLALAFQQLGHGNARPLVDHLGNIVRINHLIQFLFFFPGQPFSVKLLFKAQAFSLDHHSAFVIAFNAGLFLVIGHAVYGAFLVAQALRQRVQGDSQLGCSFVHQVDSLIRQLAVGHVS